MVVNNTPFDPKLIKIDLDQDPCFQVMTQGPEGEDLKDMLWELVEWTQKFNEENYNDFFRFFAGEVESEKPVYRKAGGEHMQIHLDYKQHGPDNQWRIVWRDFVIGWYKHPKRCVTANRILTKDERMQFLVECMVDLLPYMKKTEAKKTT